MEARLNAAKLSLTLALLEKILRKKAIKRRDLESVAGKLNWIAKVVYGGRTFLRRIIDAIQFAISPILFPSLAACARICNGTPNFSLFLTARPVWSRPALSLPIVFPLMLLAPSVMAPSFRVHISPSPLPRRPLSFPTIPRWTPPFTFTRFLPSLLPAGPCRMHCPVSFCAVTFQIVVSAVNKGTSKGEYGPLIMQYLRSLFWLSACHDFRLTARYISSKNNVLSDALSRNDWPLFHTSLRAYISSGALY
jgi:hypothetical protein